MVRYRTGFKTTEVREAKGADAGLVRKILTEKLG
jgi:hypothetical protein